MLESRAGDVVDLAIGAGESGTAVPPVTTAAGPSRRRMSGILEALVARTESERVSFGHLVDAFETRAYGPLIVVFAAPNILPVALPGISAVLGAPLILLTAQLVAGQRRPWLPGVLRRRSLARTSFEALVARIVPRLRRVEAGVAPRWLAVTGPLGKRLIGLLGVLLATIIFLPVPFGNVVPGIALVLMAVGMLARDGLMVLAGGAVGMAGLAIASGFVYGAALAGVALLRGGFGV